MVKADRVGSVARGIALFVGAFTLLNLAARWRRGFDANVWWIDFDPLPAGVGMGALAGLPILLLAWAVAPRMGGTRTALTVSLLVLIIAVAIFNTVTYYRLRAAHVIAGPWPAPLSLGVAAVFAVLLRRVIRRPAPLRARWALLGFAACAVGFPLAQVAGYGYTDYRRPADAILVLGARAHADGSLSDALADRLLTAVALYQQGHAPRLILSGGPGDGAVTEAQAMRRAAIARGVPASAIVLDDAGLTTDASVRNAARILGDSQKRVLVVSHGWHLPRAKLRCQREGLTAYTVPADERGRPLRQTPFLIAREVPALWLYYLRAVLG